MTYTITRTLKNGEKRVITLKWVANPDIYKCEGEVITQKFCKICNQWKVVDEFYISSGTLIAVCKPCYKLDRSPKYYEKRVKTHYRGRPKHVGWEARLNTRDGVEGYTCRKCRTWKPVIDYAWYTDFLKKTQDKVRRPRLNQCKQCTAKLHHRWTLLRRVRQVFGDQSQEFNRAENEKRHYHLKAVCRLLGVLSYKKFLPPSEREVWGVLPSLPAERDKFEESVNKFAEQEKAKKDKAR